METQQVAQPQPAAARPELPQLDLQAAQKSKKPLGKRLRKSLKRLVTPRSRQASPRDGFASRAASSIMEDEEEAPSVPASPGASDGMIPAVYAPAPGPAAPEAAEQAQQEAEAMTEVTSVQAAPTTALAASQPARAGGFMLCSLLRAAVVVAVAAVALGAAALPTAKGSARSGAKAPGSPGSHKKW